MVYGTLRADIATNAHNSNNAEKDSGVDNVVLNVIPKDYEEDEAKEEKDEAYHHHYQQQRQQQQRQHYPVTPLVPSHTMMQQQQQQQVQVDAFLNSPSTISQQNSTSACAAPPFHLDYKGNNRYNDSNNNTTTTTTVGTKGSTHPLPPLWDHKDKRSKSTATGATTATAETDSNTTTKDTVVNENAIPKAVSERKVKAVNYDTKNHVSVLFQMHGSVWPKVFPYCLSNVSLTVLIYYLREYQNINLTFSDKGHSFMSMMVSFLVVTRSSIVYSRFMEAREYLNEAMKACREFTQHAITFTRYETGPKAKMWRAEILRRTLVLLRTAVSVLEYQTKGQHAWKVPELTQDEKQALLMSVGRSNERSPIVLAVFLRSAISSNKEFLDNALHCNKELKLFAFVSDFVTAYHGLMKLVTTPFPFPLVQMGRTFLFVWVFTLPFALVNDVVKLPALILIVFFITYGFVGLEYVSIELDNPFGDEPNDFDVLGLAQVVFEDIYIAAYDIDGKDAAKALRESVENPLPQETQTTVTKHKRYCSIDAWQNAVPAPKVKVGTDRSILLSATKEHNNNDYGTTHSRQRSFDLSAVFEESPLRSPLGNYHSTALSSDNKGQSSHPFHTRSRPPMPPSRTLS